MQKILILLALFTIISCSTSTETVPVVGFVDGYEDETLYKARDGFYAALADSGYSEDKGTLKVIYRNAQGNIPTLTQIVQYFVSENVTLMATNPTISTITAVQRNNSIPIFQMVSPEPSLVDLNDKDGNPPVNLFGAMEILDYINTSFSLIPAVVKPKGTQLVVGMIYNQAEPQSVVALERIQGVADSLGVKLEVLPVNSSADAQLVTRSLVGKGIDAFFANPDNAVFASFETILAVCNENGVPIFTSEEGLVARGAVAAYGADLYDWGYQSGLQAVRYLKTGSTDGLALEMVQVRKHVFNAEAARRFGLTFPAEYEAID